MKQWLTSLLPLLPVLSLPSRSRLLRPPDGPGVPSVWHRRRHLLHLHHGLSQELSLWWLPLPIGTVRPPSAAATMLQQPEPGWLPGSRWTSSAKLSVPQWVHRHQLLPHPAHPQSWQCHGLQETQHAPKRRYALVCGSGQPATSAEHGPASNPTLRTQPTQLRRLEHGGERLRELWGGDVLRLWRVTLSSSEPPKGSFLYSCTPQTALSLRSDLLLARRRTGASCGTIFHTYLICLTL